MHCPASYPEGIHCINLNSESMFQLLLGDTKRIRHGIAEHTYRCGSDIYSMMLSKQPAQSVANVLPVNKVNALGLTTQGFAESQPIARNSTVADQASNRRVEFQHIPTGMSLRKPVHPSSAFSS